MFWFAILNVRPFKIFLNKQAHNVATVTLKRRNVDIACLRFIRPSVLVERLIFVPKAGGSIRKPNFLT